MSLKDVLVQEIEQVLEFILEDVLAFVRSLKEKHTKDKLEISLLSASSLEKDWLRPKENEAWRDL